MTRYEAKISYVTDYIGEDDPVQATQNLIDRMAQFGAQHVTIKMNKWTGAGEHEWVSSGTPGLQQRLVCVKCLKPQDKAAERCPGISE